MGRLTKQQYPDATSVVYTYDAASRLTQVQDPTGTYSLMYDNLSRLTQASTVYSFLAGKTFAVSYSYDAGSNRIGLTDPNGSSTSYIFDGLNRLASLKDFKRNSFTFSYDALGRTTTLARPNGVSSTYQYDAVSNLLSVLHQNGTATLDGALYVYDPAGNRTAKTNKLNNVTSNLVYDNLYQLTGVTQGTSAMESYTYDAVGNRLSAVGGTSYSYNASNELLGAGRALMSLVVYSKHPEETSCVRIMQGAVNVYPIRLAGLVCLGASYRAFDPAQYHQCFSGRFLKKPRAMAQTTSRWEQETAHAHYRSIFSLGQLDLLWRGFGQERRFSRHSGAGHSRLQDN